MGGACRTQGEIRNACRSSVIKPEGWRPLWWTRHRWKENIITVLIETGFQDIHMDQQRIQWLGLVNTVMNLRIL